MEKGEQKKHVHVDLPIALALRLKVYCAGSGAPMRRTVELLISQYLDKVAPTAFGGKD
jgi:hypothetical protein